MFDYGTAQEINAPGSLLGKIMPVCFPNITYKEHGCEVINLSDAYAVISGDGNCIDQNHSNKIVFARSLVNNEQRTYTTPYQGTIVLKC